MLQVELIEIKDNLQELVYHGFKVSDTGYFVYCNGLKDKDRFDEKLDFKISLLDYKGNGDWIKETLESLVKLLNQ